MNRMHALLITLYLGAETHLRARDEKGSVTTEHVLWAVAVIAFVGIAVAAVRGYVESNSGPLKE